MQTIGRITQTLDNISIALPLTLLNFTAIKQHNTVQLHWQTTNEVNTSYFNIQRSTDAMHFSQHWHGKFDQSKRS